MSPPQKASGWSQQIYTTRGGSSSSRAAAACTSDKEQDNTTDDTPELPGMRFPNLGGGGTENKAVPGESQATPRKVGDGSQVK